MAIVNGTENSERIDGTASDDTIVGMGGNDSIHGGAGTDVAVLPFQRSHALWETVDGGLRFRSGPTNLEVVFVSDDVEFVEFAEGTAERILRVAYADLEARAEPLGGVFDGDGAGAGGTAGTPQADIIFGSRPGAANIGDAGSDLFFGGFIGRRELGNFYDGARFEGDLIADAELAGQDRLIIDWSLFDGFNPDPGQAAAPHEVSLRFLSFIGPDRSVLTHLEAGLGGALLEVTDASGNSTFGVPVTGDMKLRRIEALDLRGTTGNDSIPGGSGDDVIDGFSGNDIIWGNEGVNDLQGGSGDDTVHGGQYGHWNGGEGVDLLVADLSWASQPVIFDARSGAPSPTWNAGSWNETRFSGFEDFDLVLTSGDDIFIPGAGKPNSGLTHVRGGAGNDTLHAPDPGGWSYGEATLRGGTGTDTLVIDYTDVALRSGVRMYDAGRNDSTEVTDITQWFHTTFDILDAAEFEALNFSGSNRDDRVFGGALADSLRGNGDDDTLTGHGGDDLLDGGAGDDVLRPGDGSDTVIGGLGDDTVDITGGADSVETGEGDDSISISGGIALVDAGSDSDTLDAGTSIAGNWAGGNGLDFLFADFSAMTAGILHNAETGAHSTSDGSLRFSGFEHLVASFGSGDDHIVDLPGGTQGAPNGRIDMGGGNDTLDISLGGMRGATLSGGAGEDLLILDASAPVPGDPRTVENVNMRGAAVEDRLPGTASIADVVGIFFDGLVRLDELSGFERVNISGTQDKDELFGGALSDTLIGNGGNDLLVGAGGRDSIDGGAGEDVVATGATTAGEWHGGTWADMLIADLSGLTSAIRYDAATGEHRSQDGALRFSSFESLQISLGDGDDHLRDEAGAITSNPLGATHSRIDMGGGNDTVELSLGGLDRATVAGGAGDDRLIIDASAASSETFDVVRIRMIDASGQAPSDPETTLEDIAEIRFSGRRSDGRVSNGLDIDLSGFESADIVATDSDDVLFGGSGDDRLAGRGGNDLLGGGSAGNDTVVFGVSSETVTVRRLAGDDLLVISAEGTDTLSGIDVLEFSDRAMAAGDFAPPAGGVQILGDTVEGATLRAVSGIVDAGGIGDLAYRWLRDGTDIGGATGATYRLTPADEGGAIAVRVAYTDGFGMDETVTSAATGAVAARQTIAGTEEQDRLTGTDSPERIAAGAGNDRLDGGAGFDDLAGGAGDDFLYGDGLKVAAVADIPALVYRLYLATLAREPDIGGHLGWTQAILEGVSAPVQVAAGFVASPEFQNTYGALDDPAFVELLYQNVLNRASDPDGLRGWLDQLAAQATRADVVLGFADSAEFQNSTSADALRWIDSHTDSVWSDDVYRLYQATLNREPDLAGFVAWMGLLGTGTAFPAAIEGFTGSPEFQNTYGALDNTGFVTLLYQNVLNRAPDAGGLAEWLGRLDGETTRAQVVEGFVQSVEFINATAAPLVNWMRGQGIDDVLDGGSGANVLVGGRMSDVFVFDQADGGTHRVLDLEAWDNLRFDGFGYASAAETRAQMIQEGNDVVFTDQGTTVVLAGTALGLIDDAMIL
ncbi:MAG: DUF4214 domain-containing protein [Rhodobacteraceae bacterium]|nr:DUF4214 domain-containing protein [Paracoccaceae bacterium]